MAHSRLQQMAFYLGGGCPPSPMVKLLGVVLKSHWTPHEKKPVQ
jgi:hypothetical protein